MTSFDTVLDLLDHGCDGEPRWIALDAANAHDAASLARFVAGEAERRGYLAVSADRFEELARALPDEQQHRTFALLQTCRAPVQPDASVLMRAAIVNPRPHVLITITIASRFDSAASGPSASLASGFSGKSGFRLPPSHEASADRRGGQPEGTPGLHSETSTRFVVREARTMYAAAPARVSPPPIGPESLKHVVRAEQACELARAGRHEPAIRLMRDAFAALMRRQDGAAAARVGILLGRLLLERGQPQAADKVFADAAAAIEVASPLDAARARVWLALARTDGGRLTDAEAILRATRITGALHGEVCRAWADAALARCLLWQQRADEAAQLFETEVAPDADADPFLVVNRLATHSRVLLATGCAFEAGQRARAAVEWAERSDDLLVQVIAHTAHLRVLASAGDVDLVAERKMHVLNLAKQLHAPLRALRVRLLWVDMLRRAGCSRDADREVRRLERASAAAPPLLRRQIEQVIGNSNRPSTKLVATHERVPFAVTLLRIAQDEDDDRMAAQKVLDRFARHVRAARVELQSAAGGALSTLIASGSGLACQLGARASEAGIIIGPERLDGAWELAAPIRAGHRLLGVISCRWPLGRDMHPGASEWLELVTAVLAPRVELLLAVRVEIARAAVEIPELIGVSAAIADVRHAIGRAASAPFAVIVDGESGVGKELVARAVHHLSARRDRRFCDINCAALPDDLIEAELFGHAKGAFTGALVERPGLFEEAHGGTLFLDELPDLSLRAQAKLLRVLQQGEIRRVGESFSRRVDVRLVTATNRSMTQEVADGRFRQDLLYRLDVIRIRIPPLRDRPEDVPVLARHFWKDAAARAGTRAVLSHRVLGELARYHWPGNVRELQNVISALAVAAPSRGTVRPTLLPSAITGSVAVSSARLSDARAQFERRFIEVALARAGGSRTRAAAQLGISRQGLLKLMTRLGLADQPEHAVSIEAS